jgi:hypothetical protein
MSTEGLCQVAGLILKSRGPFWLGPGFIPADRSSLYSPSKGGAISYAQRRFLWKSCLTACSLVDYACEKDSPRQAALGCRKRGFP